jgi:signal transduction histidine kinase
VVNVLNNAIKYTEKGSVRLSVDYTRVADICTLIFKVSDTGIGIKKEDLPKVFEKFDRVDMETNKTIEGTGLGLAIVKRLLSMMDGSIDVESEYGKGSTFTLRVPQKVDKDEAIGD